jgi:hypothetical protein
LEKVIKVIAVASDGGSKIIYYNGSYLYHDYAFRSPTKDQVFNYSINEDIKGRKGTRVSPEVEAEILEFLNTRSSKDQQEYWTK